MKKIIGIAGNARSGKDTVGGLLKDIFEKKGQKVCVVSFAQKLREEVDQFCVDKLGISAFTTNDEEKKIIRPFLVCWGTEIRRATNDNYWIEALEQSMNDDETLYIITDMRFINEYDFIKGHSGSTIYLERGTIFPANHYERTNNALLKNLVDFVWEMPTTRDMNELKAYTEKKCLQSFENIL